MARGSKPRRPRRAIAEAPAAQPSPQPALTSEESELYRQLLARLPQVSTPQAPGSPSYTDAPEVFATAINCTIVVNDVNVTFVRPRMLFGVGPDGMPTQHVAQVASAYVTMSIDTAKDLMLSLQKTLAYYEKDFGEVETAFSRLSAKEAEVSKVEK